MWVVPPNLVRVVRTKGKIQWKREIKRKKAQKNFPSSRTVGNFCGGGFFLDGLTVRPKVRNSFLYLH